jgi:hypothetical protein
MNIATNHGTSTNEELSQNSFSAIELADADLAIISGACSEDSCALIGAGLSLGFGLGLGCQGSYDPSFFYHHWHRFGFNEFHGIQAAYYGGCDDPCR